MLDPDPIVQIEGLARSTTALVGAVEALLATTSKAPIDVEETMGSEGCAVLLRCTPGRVEELARKGQIPGVKFGRELLFVREDLLAFVAEKAREEAAERRLDRAPRAVPQPLKGRRRNIPPPLPVPPGAWPR